MTADALALRALLREHGGLVEAALEQGLSARDDSAVVRRIAKLELDIRAPSLEVLDAELGSRVLAALHEALDAAASVDELSTASHARAQWIHYLETGSLRWPMAGLARDEAQAALESAAVAAAEDFLSDAADLPLRGGGSLAARVAAYERWLALLPDAVRDRLVERARRARSDDLLATWDAADAPSTLGSRALRLALTSGADGSPAVLRRWIDERRSTLDARTVAAVERALAARRPSTADHAPNEERAGAPAETTEDSGRFVPFAGLVLLHPYLPRLFAELGLWDRGARGPLSAVRASRAISVLRWLAAGRDDPHEHELPAVKLLLGLPPDEPLDEQPAPTTVEDREEGAALLAAVIGHWPALRNTGIDALRTSFLQRRGLLARRDSAWHLHLESQSFDLLLAQLPWSLSPIRLPWSDAPLYVEWRAP